MIDISITKYPMRIVSKGHATGAGEPGNNLICCSVSTMIYNGAEGASFLDINHSFETADGYADLTFNPRPARAYDAEIVFKTIMAGLLSLAQQYPEYIRVRKEYE